MYNERSAIILAAPLLLMTSVLIAVALWIMRGKSFVNFYPKAGQFLLVKTGKPHVIAVGYCFSVILISVVIPVVYLFDMAGSLQNFQKAWTASASTIEFSVLMAIMAAAVMVVLAFFLAYSLMKATGKLKLILDYLTQLPFAFPPVLLGIGLTKVWNQPLTDWIYGSYAIIVLGYLAHLIPFVIRIIYSGLQQIPPVFEEAGRLTGNRWWKVLRVITLPMLGGFLLTGFAISFVFALADLGTSLLIMPPGLETMPIVIYNYLHYGADNLVAVFCLMLLFFQYVIWLGLTALYKKTIPFRIIQ